MGKIRERHYRRRSDSGSDSSRSPPRESRDHRRGPDRRRSRSRERSRRDHHYRSRSCERKDRTRRRSKSRSRSPYRKRDKRDNKDKVSDSKKYGSSSHDHKNTHSHRKESESSSSKAKKPDKQSQKDDQSATGGESSLEAAKKIQETIEEEMKKRRDRLMMWRQKMEDEQSKVQESTEESDMENKRKGWSLEDEDEDEENTSEVMEEGGGDGGGGGGGEDKGSGEVSVEGVDGKGSGEGSGSGEVGEGVDGKDSGEVSVEGVDGKGSGEGSGSGDGGSSSDKDSKKEVQKEGEGMEEDVDPLDVFMVGVQEEVKQINKDFQKKSGSHLSSTHKSGSTIVTVTKVKQTVKAEVQPKVGARGELLHNDQDAMEYSEEEEEGDDELVSALNTISKKTKGKDLPKVDHNKVEYVPFRKNFYVEVPEIARMTNEDAVAYRAELEHIKVKGKQCPKPIKTWAQCGLASKISDVMKKNNYEKPTPIQAQAIPAIMSGRDLIGIAKTGSGKTLAFLLPMLRHILDQAPLEGDDGPIAVILSPTRELAIQIYNECRKFCKLLKLWCICVYGGTGISEQISDLKRGGEIVVCTPGRMIDMLAANGGRVTNLRRTTYLVLDEADRMFDMGFEPQVMKIINNTRPDRQTVLFSATFPRQMEAIARKILTKPIEVQVGGRSIVCKDVHQSVVVIEDHQKFFKLLELLGIYYEKGSVLVFVERQEAADALIRDLMKSSYSCLALHGGMDQFDRDSTISDFKKGNIKILVATSVAARGLDVKQLILVINYDCPNHYEDYVHRCGRTGRAGKKGFSYTFVTTEQEKFAGDVIRALELSGTPVPEELDEIYKKYMERLKAEGKIKSLPSGRVVPIIKKRKAIGFSGKGFKFDEREAVKGVESKLKQKSALGMADDDDEDHFALLTLDKKLEDIFGNKVTVHDPNAPILPNPKPGILPTPPPSDLLLQATAIANKIMLSKKVKTVQVAGNGAHLAAQEAASTIMKGGNVEVTGAILASQIAASINAKVGAAPAQAKDTFLPVGTVIAGQESAASEQSIIKYTDEVEINSFPQQIRFRITMREVLDDIGEFSESYVTVRGIYVPAPREPKPGEKRLFLSLEAKSERAIQIAKQEIKRVIKEEAQRMASRIHPGQQTGRYSVL